MKGRTKVNYCSLCLTEKKHLIEYFNKIRLFRKNSEFINTCRYQSNLLLNNLKRNDCMDLKYIEEAWREVFLYFCQFNVYSSYF